MEIKEILDYASLATTKPVDENKEFYARLKKEYSTMTKEDKDYLKNHWDNSRIRTYVS